MGQKVHPHGFRLGVIKTWDSRWYAGRNYRALLNEDREIRDLIRKKLANAAVARIEIERVAGTQISVTLHTAKPGIVIGKNGESVERLRQDLERTTKKKVRLAVQEIRTPDIEAVLVARSIAEQLEKRVAFRRAMKQAVQRCMRGGAKGVKIVLAGRLGGAEIARTEKEVEGSVPLQTLRANIDYGTAEAHTTFGVCGVKVWIYHGDVLPEKAREGAAGFAAMATPLPSERPSRDRGPRGGGERGGDRRGGPGAGGRGPRPAGAGTRGPRPEATGAEGERPRAPRPPRAPRAAAPGAEGAEKPKAPRATKKDTAAEGGAATDAATTEAEGTTES